EQRVRVRRRLALDRLVEPAQRIGAHLVQLRALEAELERAAELLLAGRKGVAPLLGRARDQQVLAVEDLERRGALDAGSQERGRLLLRELAEAQVEHAARVPE